jgi:hypothetical protein
MICAARWFNPAICGGMSQMGVQPADIDAFHGFGLRSGWRLAMPGAAR